MRRKKGARHRSRRGEGRRALFLNREEGRGRAGGAAFYSSIYTTTKGGIKKIILHHAED